MQAKFSLKHVTEPFKMIPEGRKVVMTDQVIDTWLAAHYGIDPDHMPRKQPQSVPRHLFERFKKLRVLSHNSTQVLKSKRQSESKQQQDQQKNRQNTASNKRDTKNTTQNSYEQNSNTYQYRLAPEQFDLISYPKIMDPVYLKSSVSKTNLSIQQNGKQQQLLEQEQAETHAQIAKSMERSKSQFMPAFESKQRRQPNCGLNHIVHNQNQLI